MKKKYVSRLINISCFLFVSIGLFLLFRNGDWSKIVFIKDNVNYAGIIAVIFLGGICQFLVIFRWYLLLIPIKNDIRLGSICRIAIGAILLNHVAPGKVGYPAKAYFLKKSEDIPISSSVPSLFAELMLDYSITLVLFLFAVVTGGYAKDVIRLISGYLDFRYLWAIPIFVIIIILIVIPFKRRIQSSNISKNLVAAIGQTKKRLDILLWVVLITLIYLVIWFISDYILVKSLGYNIPLIFLIFAGAFTNIVVILAPLPGGLGVREISSAYLFKVFFNLGEVALVMILLSRLFTFITLFILYFGDWIMRLVTSNKNVMQRVTKPELTGDISKEAI
ncbi:MAG TPA: lysylphosphatidylglycerol synthase transmembrane domain-containing protein [bacterium]